VDGVILEWRGRRATFLPQVWEQLPQTRAFLNALKLKAGLAPDFWAEDLRLARYQVRKFTEADETEMV
jgi:AMMECR1 domain-containing protein